MRKRYSVTLNTPFNNYCVLGEFDTEEEALQHIYTTGFSELDKEIRDEITFPRIGRITIWRVTE